MSFLKDADNAKRVKLWSLDRQRGLNSLSRAAFLSQILRTSDSGWVLRGIPSSTFHRGSSILSHVFLFIYSLYLNSSVLDHSTRPFTFHRLPLTIAYEKPDLFLNIELEDLQPRLDHINGKTLVASSWRYSSFGRIQGKPSFVCYT